MKKYDHSFEHFKVACRLTSVAFKWKKVQSSFMFRFFVYLFWMFLTLFVFHLSCFIFTRHCSILSSSSSLLNVLTFSQYVLVQFRGFSLQSVHSPISYTHSRHSTKVCLRDPYLPNYIFAHWLVLVCVCYSCVPFIRIPLQTQSNLQSDIQTVYRTHCVCIKKPY